MVKAELSHNPYLLETKVKFNGKTPKINSLIEKYQHAKLQTWLCQLPKIFYNEMNGYDFEFDFTGTESDYQEIIDAFLAVGLTVETETNQGAKNVMRQIGDKCEQLALPLNPGINVDVRIFLKNELQGAHAKSQEIATCLQWLETNPNRRFDYGAFRTRNTEIFDEDDTYLLIQGSSINTSNFNIKDITIENANELADLPRDLTNTPILFYLDESTLVTFELFFETLLARTDVSKEQFFFFIHSTLNTAQNERMIQDLGIKQPQIISKLDDDKIHRFLRVYPITDYVGASIVVLQSEATRIMEILKNENEASRVQNYEVRREIGKQNLIIKKLKQVNDQFVQKDNLEIRALFEQALDRFIYKIQQWRKRKVSINNDSDAWQAANEYEHELNVYFAEFLAEVMVTFKQVTQTIESDFADLYSRADYHDAFVVKRENHIDFSEYYLQEITADFLAYRKEQMVEKPEEFFGLKKMFTDKTVEPRPLVPEITYSLSQWREHAQSVIGPQANMIIDTVVQNLKSQYEAVAQTYEKHLAQLVIEHTKQKEMIAAKLSDEEQKLQIDNDWLAQLQEMINLIARG